MNTFLFPGWSNATSHMEWRTLDTKKKKNQNVKLNQKRRLHLSCLWTILKIKFFYERSAQYLAMTADRGESFCCIHLFASFWFQCCWFSISLWRILLQHLEFLLDLLSNIFLLLKFHVLYHNHKKSIWSIFLLHLKLLCTLPRLDRKMLNLQCAHDNNQLLRVYRMSPFVCQDGLCLSHLPLSEEANWDYLCASFLPRLHASQDYRQGEAMIISEMKSLLGPLCKNSLHPKCLMFTFRFGLIQT